MTGRSGAYGRCNTGQLYALVRRQAAARRQDPTVTAMRRRSQLGVKELESELPAYCSEAVGLYFFICTSHEVVMCDKKHTPPNFTGGNLARLVSMCRQLSDPLDFQRPL